MVDRELENTSIESLDIPNVDAPHEVLGDFLTSLVRVVNHRKRYSKSNWHMQREEYTTWLKGAKLMVPKAAMLGPWRPVDFVLILYKLNIKLKNI